MDRHKSFPAWLLISLCLVWLSGCGWGSASSDNSADDDIADAADVPPTAAQPAAPPTASPAPADRPLVAGQRFPLLKTVTQTLQQASPGGWTTSRSTVEILMSVTVEEIRPSDGPPRQGDPLSGQKRLQVNYQRVRFSRELPGQTRLEYDSNAPGFPVPQAALGYHGLRGNGFGFWLGPDNQIVELTAFEQFVNRCLNEIPAAQRQQAAAAMALPPADAVAFFVDDTVGILPGRVVREGESWVRDRQVAQPVALHVSNRYTLRRITPELAEIEILGSISPPVPHGSMNQPDGNLRVVVRGGRSQGTCLLDRRTGLPVDSRTEQHLEMMVRMPDGAEFEQQKAMLTTVKSAPESAPPFAGTTSGTISAGSPARDAQGLADGRSAAPRQ